MIEKPSCQSVMRNGWYYNDITLRYNRSRRILPWQIYVNGSIEYEFDDFDIAWTHIIDLISGKI